MSCPCCAFGDSADRHFNADKVAKELALFRRKGPRPTTRRLLDGLVSAGLREGTILDIGGGLGILSLELLDAGFSHAVVVDASPAYLAAGSEDATRRGRSPSTEFVRGDFLAMAHQFSSASVVTLDRVVCCYPLYVPLLEYALKLARTGFALSYPRNRWFVRAGNWFENAIATASRQLVSHIHPSTLGHDADRGKARFELASRQRTPAWSSDVFVKRP